MEDILDPIEEEGICTDEEIQMAFSSSSIQTTFQKIQVMLLDKMTNTIFKLKISNLYNKNFLDLDMEYILNESFKFFEDYTKKMAKSTSRLAWTTFLEKTVLCYI